MFYMLKKKYLLPINWIPLILIFFPISPEFYLNGYPFDNLFEVIIFVLAIFCIFYSERIINNKKNIFILFLAVTSLIISNHNAQNSFNACYSTAETPNSNFEMSFDIDQDCQFSFSNPFNRSITRTDFNLNFNPNPIRLWA